MGDILGIDIGGTFTDFVRYDDETKSVEVLIKECFSLQPAADVINAIRPLHAFSKADLDLAFADLSRNGRIELDWGWRGIVVLSVDDELTAAWIRKGWETS